MRNSKLPRWNQMVCRYIIITSILYSFILSPANAQETYQLKDMFMDAESWFYFQDYENSLPLYLEILDAYPENHNFNYKAGICYLNLEGQKHKAIPYLKKATENTTFNYSQEAFYEKKAPVDAIFYLGNAYLIDNQIDKALEAYEKFEEKAKGKKWFFRNIDFDFKYLQKQKEKCKTAKELMSKPVSYTAENVGAPINTPESEYNPIVSGDEKTMVFTAEKKFYTGVFMSKKENGKWGPPENLLPQLGIDGDCETTSLSYDGKEMYLYREDNLRGNIYVSYYENGSWSSLKKLGENINTKYWESHAFITQDGQYLYFTSNREDGYGNLDIYKSERKDDSTWGEPENLGETINTEWNEDTPFLTNDGKTLFFSSKGHYNMGGFDLFVSQKTEDGWTEPQNLGYPINTTDDNRFMAPMNNGEDAYYAHLNKTASNKKDIFKYHLKDIHDKEIIDIEGIMTYESEEDKNRKDFTINLINKKTNDTIAKLNPDDPEENFTFDSLNGKPHLRYQTPLLDDNKQYIVSKNFEVKERYLSPKLADKDSKEISTTPQINLDKEIFKADTEDEDIKIKLQLKGGNKLIVKTHKDGELVNSEEFTLEDEDFIYEYSPDEKEAKLTFQLFENDKNILSKDVTISPDTSTTEKTEESHEKLIIQEKNVAFEEGKKKIKIKLSTLKDSKLFVESFTGDSLINTEEFNITQEDFTYEFEPKHEKSRLNFKSIDQSGNIKSQEVLISHRPIDSELEFLLNNVNKYSLSELLLLADSDNLSQASVDQLLDSLFSKSDSTEISAQEGDILLVTATLLKAGDTKTLYNDLYDIGNQSIKDFLSKYDWRKLKNNENILSLLKWGVQENEIQQSTFRTLLKNYLIDNYTADELRELLTILSEFDINKILNEPGVDALNVVTADDLIKIIEEKNIGKQDQIIAFLESQVLLNKQFDTELFETASAPKPKTDEEQRKTKTLNYILSTLSGLILLLIIILWIKKSKKSVSKN